MQRQRQRTALVTGASSGIGAAFADLFASEGFDLVVTARRVDRLRELADRLRSRHGRAVHVIGADLSARDAPLHVCDELVSRGLIIDALVNNAGFGIAGAYTSATWARQEALLQIHVVAPAELVHRLVPGMIERRYGRIINVASLAALLPAPAGHTLYPASKAFLVRFSEALAEETQPYGVNVTALCPGFTRSEFHDVTGTREKISRLPRFMVLDAEGVAREGFRAVMAGTPVHVTGRINRSVLTAARYLPASLVSAASRGFGRAYRDRR